MRISTHYLVTYIYFFLPGRVREKRSHSMRFYGLCSHSERSRLDACLKKKGHDEVEENHLVCTRNKIVISCFYLVSCEHVNPNSAVYNYTCGKIYHQRSYVAKCCGVLGCWLGSSYHPGTSLLGVHYRGHQGWCSFSYNLAFQSPPSPPPLLCVHCRRSRIEYTWLGHVFKWGGRGELFNTSVMGCSCGDNRARQHQMF